MDINGWLNKFKSSWENKNFKNVLSLFSNDVVYYESPFKKLNGFSEIEKEWATIADQESINLNFIVSTQEDNKYTVQWDLKYSKKEDKSFHYSGVYLIKLNEAGLCDEFRQYCEEE